MFILAWVAGAKRGGGGGRRKSSILSFSPSTLSPTPFDACYAGFVHDWSLSREPITQQEEKKRWGRGYLLLFCFLRATGDSNMPPEILWATANILRFPLPLRQRPLGFLVDAFRWHSRLRNKRRNSSLMTCHYSGLGRASDCSEQEPIKWIWWAPGWNKIFHALGPVRRITQIWVVTFISMEFLRCLRSFLSRPPSRGNHVPMVAPPDCKISLASLVRYFNL